MSFSVYRSSAGSGKTFTLVKEYLKIILADPAGFRHILAITFTNKAANEMKERVLKALSELSKGGDSQDAMIRNSLLPALLNETGLTGPEITRNAAVALEMILHNYADFAIGTIDGFSHRLIRTFAHDFGLPVNFNVELDADELLGTAVDLLLDRVGDDATLTSLLVKFLESRLEEDKGWNIAQILAGFAKILLDEEGQGRIRGLKDLTLEHFSEITADLYSRIRIFESNVRKIAQEGFRVLKLGGFSPADLYQGERGLWNYFANLAAGKMDKMEPNSYVAATIEEDKWFSGKAGAAARASIEAVKLPLSAVYERLKQDIEANRQMYALRKLLAKTIYPIAVLNEIERTLSTFKQQNNVVHISEFNARIAGIVMNEPVPFIYERLGDTFHHLLIDEFQDTSALQWLNIVPLIENSLAGGNFNLVVGDGKQAIYRWRGGEVEQFNALPALTGSSANAILKQRENSLNRHFNSVNLGKNFRSRAEIVDFNNRFFRAVAGNVLTNGKEKIYEGLEQEFDPGKTGGYISLEFIEGDGPEAGYQEKTLSQVREIILKAQGEGFSLKEMAVLCRSNKNASLVARHLLEQGMDVVSAESLLIAGSTEVRFLIACLKFLFQPKNDIVMAEIRQYVSAAEQGRKRTLDDDRNELSLLPVYDLCEALIRKFNLDSLSDPYLRFFLDAVLKFSVRVSTQASEFLDWWEKNREKLSIIVPEELNAVRVMTIHKAKGLEFPLVILPFAAESLKNTRPYLWVDLEPDVLPGLGASILQSEKEMENTVYSDQYADERQKSMLDLVNILYVAMTRASERLYILTKPPPKSQDEVNSIPGFFRIFLQSEGIWTDDGRLYAFGSESIHTQPPGKSSKQTYTPGKVASSDWRKKIEIRQRAPHMWDLDAPVQKSLRGNMIHTVLSWMITATDIPAVIDKAVLTGLTDRSEAASTEQILRDIVEDQRLSRLFSDQVKAKTEAEILLPEGSFYRPDRVVFDDELVTILDYKTGNPSPMHGEQLIRYSGYIGQMGYQKIRRLLVYLEPGVNVVEV